MLRRPHPKRHACPVTAHAHPLVREFFELLAEEGVALTDVAQRAGVCAATLSKWKSRHSPTVVALAAALNVIGFELAIVRRSEVAS